MEIFAQSGNRLMAATQLTGERNRAKPMRHSRLRAVCQAVRQVCVKNTIGSKHRIGWSEEQQDSDPFQMGWRELPECSGHAARRQQSRHDRPTRPTSTIGVTRKAQKVGDITTALIPATRSTVTPALVRRNGKAVIMNPATKPKGSTVIPMIQAGGKRELITFYTFYFFGSFMPDDVSCFRQNPDRLLGLLILHHNVIRIESGDGEDADASVC